MQIWVDADACPKVVKEVLCRAATRTGLQITFVANHYVPVPTAPNIKSIQVESGFDVADDEIVRRSEAGDLVISGDIPLAAELIENKVQVLNPRGELYTEATIKARLNIRDFMDTMRASGIQTGGPAALSQTERREFANQLDRILAKVKKPI
ncbi:YaiI/YqxD family protein [Aliivibrio sp. SR45-2]|uniref:YaiI/YqxD family protein n=1 Tax=Aliivibrio sp. SR45-2 TaxID=2760931 RepID=UPI0015FDD3DF|nr:YaiI/YqxD family protein [Aliivibrio sp. SR45-2]MBB1312664.1 YaiI/YqxD family protein [Aliivibrio sp. SR45-2]